MDEKLKILKMVEAGTVTAQQAADMMAEADQAEPRSIERPPGYDRKLFRITVDGAQGDKVNIQLPVGAVRRILDIAGRLPVLGGNFQRHGCQRADGCGHPVPRRGSEGRSCGCCYR